MKQIPPRMITFAVLGQSVTNEPGQLVTAGIGIAQPVDDKNHGYLTEAEEIMRRTADDVEQDVIEVALENLANRVE